jgi:hypothetical protein
LGKIEALRADIAARQAELAATAHDDGAWRAAIEASLCHRLLAMTYLQLFSPSEAWLLGINADKLYLLLDRARKHRWQIQREIKPIVDQIVGAYHLGQLEPQLGPLSFRWIVTDAFVLPEDLDYLRLG